MTHINAVYKRPNSEQKFYTRLKVKGWKKIMQAKGQERKKSRPSSIMSDKLDFKTKTIERDREGHL